MKTICNKDPWSEVLEKRVEELEQKVKTHESSIDKNIARFKEWASTASDIEILYDGEDKIKRVTKVYNTYRALWDELNKAKAELQDYKAIKNLK